MAPGMAPVRCLALVFFVFECLGQRCGSLTRLRTQFRTSSVRNHINYWKRIRFPLRPQVDIRAEKDRIPRGDTGGSTVHMSDVLISVGDSDLVRDATIDIMPGHRYGIVGKNGVGKSTLLKVLTGELLPVDGDVIVNEHASVGYLKQTAVSGSSLSVDEEVRTQMHKLNAARDALEAAENEVKANPSELALSSYEAAQQTFEQSGGYSVDSRVAKILSGLGFSEEDQKRPCSDFSGGWQMRIALARTLLSDPSLLLLDEPTNHLDSSAKNWLSGYLSEFEGTLVVVSHDVPLLKQVCDRILEIELKALNEYRCGFDKYQSEKALRLKQQQAAYEKQQLEIKKLEGFITKFGAKATKASAAESRKKQLAKIDRIEMPVEVRKKTILTLPKPPPNDQIVLSLSNGAFGWGNEALIKNCNLMLENGQRWLILGENGAGKSTLLAALRGVLPLKSGELKYSERTELGVFTQDLAQDLPQDKTALEYILQNVKDPSISDENVRSALGALGLTGPKALREIKDLSGGEKARVALALLTLTPNNLLLLDEVTNHLDSETVSTLCESLRKWSGTLCVITHDQSFAQKINPTHIATVRKNGTVDWHDGGLYTSDFIFGGNENPDMKPKQSEQELLSKEEIIQRKEEDKKLRKKKMGAPKRIQKIESLLEELERKMEEVDNALAENASDMDMLLRLSTDREALQSEIEGLYKEWEELEEFLAEFVDAA
mmetsp:Transcript_16542/g.24889  ORF Transcript_16542/g.24889 Transcript_16542/m.24889 type:complete len:718 (-) Transcript_16542:316-2469(-)